MDRNVERDGAGLTSRLLVWLTRWHVEQLTDNIQKEERTWFHLFVFEEKDKFVFEFNEFERLVVHLVLRSSSS